MTFLRRPAPRFVVWAALLVVVAAGAGKAGLAAWQIAAVELAAWLLIALCERRLSAAWGGRSPEYQAAVEEEPPAEPAVPPEPPPALPEPEPELPVLVAHVEPPPPPPPVPQPLVDEGARWNIGALELLARQHAPEDEELSFLVIYLRDFAGPDGLLPPEFDSLVRESFGGLLSRTT